MPAHLDLERNRERRLELRRRQHDASRRVAERKPAVRRHRRADRGAGADRERGLAEHEVSVVGLAGGLLVIVVQTPVLQRRIVGVLLHAQLAARRLRLAEQQRPDLLDHDLERRGDLGRGAGHRDGQRLALDGSMSWQREQQRIGAGRHLGEVGPADGQGEQARRVVAVDARQVGLDPAQQLLGEIALGDDGHQHRLDDRLLRRQRHRQDCLQPAVLVRDQGRRRAGVERQRRPDGRRGGRRSGKCERQQCNQGTAHVTHLVFGQVERDCTPCACRRPRATEYTSGRRIQRRCRRWRCSGRCVWWCWRTCSVR